MLDWRDRNESFAHPHMSKPIANQQALFYDVPQIISTRFYASLAICLLVIPESLNRQVDFNYHMKSTGTNRIVKEKLQIKYLQIEDNRYKVITKRVTTD